MAKEKETLQKKLAKRKYTAPNWFIVFLYWIIFRVFTMRKYKPEIIIQDKIPRKGACFLVWNHLSRIDHGYLMAACFPRRKINILAEYNEFFRSHLQFVFRMNKIVPKKNFCYDPAGVRAMNNVIKKGGVLAIAPEGMSSMTGINQPVTKGTGHFIRHYKIPVYFLEMRGEYLTSTKVCTKERLGRTKATLKLLFSPKQLENMTDEEVELKMDEAFRHDDYEWGKENNIKWKHKGNMAENLQDICFKCPKCGSEFHMKTEGNKIWCDECGNGANINDYYEFEPLGEGMILPKSPAQWVIDERRSVICEIRENKDFAFYEHVTVGDLPKYEFLKDHKTSEVCGEGDICFDHSGIHFTGTAHGEEFKFDLSYKDVFSLVIVTDLRKFALYVNNEFYEFNPSHETVGKLLLITEEMHRLHFNTWKNFPWFDYLYENVPEYKA